MSEINSGVCCHAKSCRHHCGDCCCELGSITVGSTHSVQGRAPCESYED